MKVAWITHRNLEGLEGGAELADMNMIAQKPDGVEVHVFHTRRVSEINFEEYHEIVVTGFLELSQQDEISLYKRRPVVWVHDMATTSMGLYEYANPLIVTTPTHLSWEIQSNPRLRHKEDILINPGYFDTSPYTPKPKEPFALWAHRDVPHKGLDLAVIWAKAKGVRLEVSMGQPREDVAKRMQVAQYFVLISHIQDPGPLAVIEAQLCGCQIVYNRKVGGFFDESPDELRARIDRAGTEFWESVLA